MVSTLFVIASLPAGRQGVLCAAIFHSPYSLFVVIALSPLPSLHTLLIVIVSLTPSRHCTRPNSSLRGALFATKRFLRRSNLTLHCIEVSHLVIALFPPVIAIPTFFVGRSNRSEAKDGEANLSFPSLQTPLPSLRT